MLLSHKYGVFRFTPRLGAFNSDQPFQLACKLASELPSNAIDLPMTPVASEGNVGVFALRHTNQRVPEWGKGLMQDKRVSHMVVPHWYFEGSAGVA